MSITAKGKRWERLHSLWIGWTFTLGIFNWIAFLYVGLRAKRRKWILWGLVYSLPFVQGVFFFDNEIWRSWGSDLNAALVLILGIIGIFHAFRIRKEYLLRLATLQDQKVYDDAALKRRLAAEYGTSLSEDTTAQSSPVMPTTAQSTLDQKSGTGTVPPKPAFPTIPASTTSPSEKVSARQAQIATTPVSPATNPLIAPDIMSRDELEYRISSAYPFPLAFGFRSLASIVDPRDLYRAVAGCGEHVRLYWVCSFIVATRAGS